jgi:uncharacterized membrane protein YfhO
MKEPIIAFASSQELAERLRYWQRVLYLTDWFIKADVVKKEELTLDGVCGEASICNEQMSAVIRILEHGSCHTQQPLKFCQEKTLVHELLHCKYNMMEYDEMTYEAAHLDLHEHIVLEQMARTLIMVHYGINADWFKAE